MSRDELEKIRTEDLPRRMMTDGVNLKQINPSSYKGHCPFHDDKNPSLSVNQKGRTWLWHCFGCDKGGDLLKYLMLKDNLAFREVLETFKSQSPERESTNTGVSELKLLREVTRYYHHCLRGNKKAQDYLKKRGLYDSELVNRFTLGFCDGRLPRQKDTLPGLKKLGVLNTSGDEHFQGCLTFPIEDSNGSVVSIYGRSIHTKRHLYLPGPHKGVFNYNACRESKRIFLTESVIDALSLYKLGVSEVVSLYGTYGLTDDHLRLLKDNSFLEDIVFCLDNDDAGRRAVTTITERLSALGKKLFEIPLPEGIKDPNDFILKGKTKEELLLKLLEINSSPAVESSWTLTEEENLLIYTNCRKSYQVRGLNTERHDTLRVTLRVGNDQDTFLDTLDLYSARQRQGFARTARKLLGLKEEELTRDLNFLLDALEKKKVLLLEKNKKGPSEPVQIPSEEKEKALSYLKDSELIDRILADAKSLGHVGEENNLLLGYLVSLSRKLKHPLGLLIVSQSGAGKTQLQDLILSLTPPEDTVRLTRLTDQSLFYQEKDALKHKLLSIEELEGAEGAGYSLRHLLSAQVLRNLATIKNEDTGHMRSVSHEVQGPTSILMTTTYSDLDFETQNRFLVITSDESRRQTREILKLQRHLETLEGILERKKHEKIRKLHHNLQRLLMPLEVVNPHSEDLRFTDTSLRSRREQKKYHTLIKTIAILRQHQKELKQAHDGQGVFGYIEVDLRDIHLANKIIKDVLLKGLDELSPQGRRLLHIIKECVLKLSRELKKDPEDVVVSRRDIREYSGWSDYQLRKQIRELEEFEYLIPVSGGKRGRRFTYLLAWEAEKTQKDPFVLEPDESLKGK